MGGKPHRAHLCVLCCLWGGWCSPLSHLLSLVALLCRLQNFCCKYIYVNGSLNGALLNSTWNYNSHETTTFERPSSTHRGHKVATTVKRRLLHLVIIERQMLHSQRPPNYNNCESTAVKWRLLQNCATTLKCNDREMTSSKLHNSCKICVRFCVGLWLFSFQVPFGSLWLNVFFRWSSSGGFLVGVRSM